MQLSVNQTRAFDLLEDQQTTELLYGGGAGGGKSMLGCLWLITVCSKYPGTRWLMGRSELKNLKQTTLKSFFEVTASLNLKSGEDFNYNQSSSSIFFSNGSEILLKDLYAYPSDPNFDSLGSLEITGGFIDECNQITEKAKAIVKSRIRYKLDENKIIPKLLMTCNPAKNWVYQQFYKPYKANSLTQEKAFIQSLVTDNPFISKHYIDNLNGLPKEQKERLLFGNWEYDDDPTSLINYDSIIQLWNNTQVVGGEKYLTCDVARFGRDKSVICVWDGWQLIKLETYSKSSMDEMVKHINRLRGQYSIPPNNCIADEDGVGGGVVDFGKIKGFVNNSSPLQIKNQSGILQPDNYRNLKSQCYFRLADRINKGNLYINTNLPTDIKEQLIAELEQVKQKNMDKDGKREIMGKDEVKSLIGRSPDLSDAIMMREYFELTKKDFFFF